MKLLATVAVTLLVSGLVSAAPPQNMIHGRPDFDSGWVDLVGSPVQVPHHLGGELDDYVIDVQLRQPSWEAGLGVNNMGNGGDTYWVGPSDRHGVMVQSYDDQDVWLVKEDESPSTQARVRVWRVESPAWDSGWVDMEAGTSGMLTHGLGGDADDYVVDMTMRSGGISHQRSVGGEWHFGDGLEWHGCIWYSLTASSVRVQRLSDDEDCPEVRLRIFVPTPPDYDSGWISVTADSSQTLSHDLGGPWNDLYVDLQHKDLDNNYGVNNFFVGGDRSQSSYRGSYWHGLTGSRIRVHRNADDYTADQVRTRIWASRAPAHDSGWRHVAQGQVRELPHGLRGDVSHLVLDLAFLDTDAIFGVNAFGHGRNRDYDENGYTVRDDGVAWSELDSDGLTLRRGLADDAADRVRLRTWHPPAPDWDSGWTDISANDVIVLAHGLDTQPADLVVDLQLRHPSLGDVHHRAYCGDRWWYDKDSDLRHDGACWRALTDNSIEVERFFDDSMAQQVRVRIWRNTAWDAAHTEEDTAAGFHGWQHDLNVPPEELVVSMWGTGSGATIGHHQMGFGADSYTNGPQVWEGAWWENLTGSSIIFARAADDQLWDDVNLRLWRTGPSDVIFVDDFECGDVSSW